MAPSMGIHVPYNGDMDAYHKYYYSQVTGRTLVSWLNSGNQLTLSVVSFHRKHTTLLPITLAELSQGIKP